MKVAIAQIKVIPGDPETNVRNILSVIEEARSGGADLVCLPEMCIGGYMIGDLYTDDEYCLELMEWGECFAFF